MIRRDRQGKAKGSVDGWMKLDNAAKIYPPVTRGELTGVFRITSILNAPVRFNALQQAVDMTFKLFPSFSVELCPGIFWYYLEYNGQKPRLLLDEGPQCQAFPSKRKGEVMYRILARHNRISVEFLHIITDGGGAMMFFKMLLNNYGNIVSGTDETKVLFPGSLILNPVNDTRDRFREHSKKRFPHPVKLAGAWHLPFRLNNKPRFKTMSFSLPAGRLAEESKKCNTTVSEFLVSVYLASLQDLRDKQKKGSPFLRVQVPVDLRRRFNTETVRNFSVFVMPELDLRMGHYSFNEIIQEVKVAIGLMADDKRLTKIISRNVSKENNPLIRVIPLFVKGFFLRMAYNRLGISQYSGVLTNMGRIDLTPEGEEILNGMFVVPPPPHPRIKVSCGVSTLGNNTIITFGSVADDNALERTFITYLTGRNIPVRLLNLK
jgi:NRPS condensation-like uncharacterized protein